MAHPPAQARLTVDHDQAAEQFRRVFLPHARDALALARWLARNPSDAEDIVQEAALRALRAIDGYRGMSARAWVLAIVRNTAFTWLKRHRSSNLMLIGDLADVDDVAQARSPDAAELPRTPEAETIRHADQQAVAEAIERLSLPLREVVVLRDINDLSYKEIAQLLELPIGTVTKSWPRAAPLPGSRSRRFLRSS